MRIMEQTVVYHTFTDEQLHSLVEETVTTTLQKFGVDFDEAKAHFTSDNRNEPKPIAYWQKKLNVNRTTIWRWTQTGNLKPTYMGKKVFFCQSDFDKLFEKMKDARFDTKNSKK